MFNYFFMFYKKFKRSKKIVFVSTNLPAFKSGPKSGPAFNAKYLCKNMVPHSFVYVCLGVLFIINKCVSMFTVYIKHANSRRAGKTYRGFFFFFSESFWLFITFLIRRITQNWFFFFNSLKKTRRHIGLSSVHRTTRNRLSVRWIIKYPGIPGFVPLRNGF